MYKLIISDLRIWTKIGCSIEERFLPRCMSFNIEISFEDPPIATISDRIEDAICYASIAREIEILCNQREFNLIEHLAAEVHKLLHKLIKIQTKKIKVNVVKLVPPVPNIYGGVSFTYSK